MKETATVSPLQKRIEELKDTSPATYEYFMTVIAAEKGKEQKKRSPKTNSKVRPISKTLFKLTRSAII